MSPRVSLVLVPALLAAACGGDGSGPRAGAPPNAITNAGAAGQAGSGTAATAGAAVAGSGTSCTPLPVAPPMFAGEGTPEEQATRRLLDSAVRAAGDIRTDVRAGCATIVGMLGCGVVTSGGSATVEDVAAACQGAIDCLGKQGSLVPAMLSGGKCEASLGLAVECDAGCGTEEPCHGVCVDAAKALSFCVEPKVTQADPKVAGAIKAALPLVHKAGKQQVAVVSDALAPHADLVASASQSGDPCLAALGVNAKAGIDSLAVSAMWTTSVLTAAGAAP